MDKNQDDLAVGFYIIFTSSSEVDIHLLITKATKRFHCLRRLFSRQHNQIRLALFKSHVLPIVDLILPLWSFLTATQIQALERSHWKILKHLIPSDVMIDCPECTLKHLKLMSLQRRRDFLILFQKFFYSVAHKISPISATKSLIAVADLQYIQAQSIMSSLTHPTTAKK